MAEDDKKDEVDFEMIEEGTEEANKLKEAQESAGADEEGDDGESDASLASQNAQPGPEADKTVTKRKKQVQRLREKLDGKDSVIRSQAQQIKQLNDRVIGVERRTGSNEMAMLDKAIIDTRSFVAQAEIAHSNSLTQNDPTLVTQAMNQLFEARNQLQNLEGVKQRVVTQVTQPSPTNPSVSRNVNAWMGRNTWYRPETDDEDSAIAKVLDNRVMSEGYDPATPEYWAELDRRIKKRLPHRAKGDKAVVNDAEDDEDDVAQDTGKQETARQTKSHVSGSGQGSGSGTRVKIVLSQARVQALKDAGMWEDPVQRNKMVRQYQRYDRDNATNR